MRAGSRVAIAVPAAGSIVVDGRLNDWPATAPEHPLRRVTAGDPINDDSDFAASFRLAWDDEGGLYIAVDIIDEAVVINDGSGDWRTQDGIELVLRAASSDEEGAVHQIALWGDHLLGSDQGLQLQTSGDAGHRLFEWRIDTASLDIDLPADRRIALDLSVNDRDDDGSFTTINWGDADRAASGLGEALLLTSPVAIGTVKGTILRDGKAVARGLVQLRPVGDTDHAWDLQADRDGRFALRLPHGAYEVSRVADSTNAVSADLRADSVEVEIRTSRSLEQSQTLGSGVTVNAGPGTAVEASFGIQKGLWRTYGLPDGLASTSIDAIYQDRNGYLWFGTQGGVSRYDGTHFTTFTIDDGLAYNGVSAIAEDADGTLWFGTWGGLSRYDGLTFTTYTTADGLADDLVLALHRGSAGRLWIGTQSGLNCLDGSDLHTYSVGHGLPHEHISAIAEEPDGSLWFGTWGGGASHFDGDDFTTYAGIDLGHDEISDIGVDAEGGIWFATQSGVSRIFGDHVRRYTETDGLAHNAASSLAFDALGRLWVGTWEGGVSRLTAAGFVNFDSDAGLAHNEVSTIAADGDGHMWFGTWGGGISRYDGNNFEHFSDVDLAGAAKALWQDHKGRLWVGTSAGLYRKDRHGFHHYTTSDGLAHNAVNAITEDQSGILWIGTQSGLSRLDGDGNVTSFTTDDGLPHNWVNAVHCDAGGRLWLGTWGGGAARFDGESFVTYNDANGLGHDWVNTIYEDGFGRLWFGTKGGGVTQLDGDVFSRLTSDDGLSANWVWDIIEDARGIMWFGTDNGVSRYQDGTLTTLTSRDGLSADHVSAILQDHQGRFWFGTDGGGVTLFDGVVFQDILVRDGLLDNVVHDVLQDRQGQLWIATSRGLTLHRPRIAPPPIHLVDVVADRRYGATDQIAISAAQDYLAFEFSGISLKTRPGALLYRYHLEGYEDSEQVGGVSRVEYVDLPLGDYTFVVQAIDRDLTPSAEPVRVAVQVHPPYGDIALYSSLVIVLLGLAWAAGQIMQRNRRLGVARDQLTESLATAEEARAEADAARRDADAASEAKSSFLANMSHEIRTPMNGIVGMVDMLRRTQMEKTQSDYLGVIDTSAEALLGLINDILDLSKVEAGGMELERIDFVLWDVMEGVMKLMAMRAHEKGLELACHIMPDVPEGVVGDPTRLRQIIVNLISNAIKFTTTGEIVLRVARVPRNDDDVELHFAVRDTGIGIPKDKQDLIFEAFSQADSSTTREFGGTGLGLNISRLLVGLMGGHIWIDSEEGVGSTFQFNAHFGDSDMRADYNADEPWKRLEDARILAVEDNATNRQILQEMFAGWGLQATILSSGTEALDELQRAADAGTPYALALLDAHATPTDGITIAQQIRLQPDLAEHVVMVTTSIDGPEMTERHKAAGVEHALRKPLAQSDLLDVIVSTLGPAVGLQSRRSEDETAERLPPLCILLADDNETNLYVATSMLVEQGHKVVTADNGRLAVEALDAAAYDLVLMDVQMPEMDGYEATAEIRRREQASGDHLPIIGLTANAMKGDRDACLAAGMDEYVPKPVRWEALRQAIVGLRIKGGTLPPDFQGESPDPATDTATDDLAAELAELGLEPLDDDDDDTVPEDVDPQLLAQLDQDFAQVADDTVLDLSALYNLREMEERGAISVQKMFDLFVDTGERILPILRQTLADHDAPVLRREAHSLKGSAGYLGARKLATLCQQLEYQAAEEVFDGAGDLIEEIDGAFADARQALTDQLPAPETPAVAPADWPGDVEACIEPESAEYLQELIEILDREHYRWAALRGTMAITEIETFGAEMMGVGTTYEYRYLESWGETIEQLARSFDVDGVEQAFSRYPELVETTRALLPT